jgi:hypothetical protein
VPPIAATSTIARILSFTMRTISFSLVRSIGD